MGCGDACPYVPSIVEEWDIPDPYIVAQLVGGVCAVLAIRALYPDITPADVAEVLLPHQQSTRADGASPPMSASQRFSSQSRQAAPPASS
jgi:hypothetical protein